uniref:hypothetical protein n=1 Tax=Ndongobacter massiliensis TaxID=1871025 RepID=UPI000930EFEE|nr:hypothetical protein [Ndongobacter massiliensis]
MKRDQKDFQKYCGRLLFLALLLLLVGCRKNENSGELNAGGIQKPTNETTLLEGTWKVMDVVSFGEESNVEKPSAFAVSDSLYFCNGFVGINGVFTVNPSISAKFVNTRDYLNARFSGQEVALKDYDEDKIRVIMVRDGESFSMDFLSLKKDRCAFSYESKMYYLERETTEIANEVRENFLRLVDSKKREEVQPEENRNRALLVGIKTKSYDADTIPVYSYATYLIREDALSRRPRVYAAEQILVPHGNQSFTLLRYQIQDRNPVYGVLESTFQATLTTADPNSQENTLIDTFNRSVTYVHDGFVAFDKNIVSLSTGIVQRKEDIFALDALAKGMPYTVEQLTGKEGQETYREQVENRLQQLHPDTPTTSLLAELDYTDIGIQRKTTDWSFHCTPQITVDGELRSAPLFLDLLQSVPVMDSDPLAVPWSQVTNKSYRASAAFSTPNKERVLILTDNELQYYRILEGRIDRSPLLSIQLPAGSSVVMMETAYDAHADVWEDAIKDQTAILPQVIYDPSFSSEEDVEAK